MTVKALTSCSPSRAASLSLFCLLTVPPTACQSIHLGSFSRAKSEATSIAALPSWLKSAIAKGPPAEKNVTSRIESENQWASLEEYILSSSDEAKLISTAVAYYLKGPCQRRRDVFLGLVKQDSMPLHQLAWNVATLKPSPELAKEISEILAQALMTGALDPLLKPEVANAIKTNHVVNAYTFLRRGLTESGGPAFAKAMLEIEPKMAVDDLLTYLGRADADALVAGNLIGVDPPTISVILEFLVTSPPGLDHPNFGHIILLGTINRDDDSILAQQIVLTKAKSEPEKSAFLLAKMPEAVQLHYLKIVRGQGTEEYRAFVDELSKTTSSTKVTTSIKDNTN